MGRTFSTLSQAIPALIEVFHDLDKDQNGMLTYEDWWDMKDTGLGVAKVFVLAAKGQGQEAWRDLACRRTAQ